MNAFAHTHIYIDPPNPTAVHTCQHCFGCQHGCLFICRRLVAHRRGTDMWRARRGSGDDFSVWSRFLFPIPTPGNDDTRVSCSRMSCRYSFRGKQSKESVVSDTGNSCSAWVVVGFVEWSWAEMMNENNTASGQSAIGTKRVCELLQRNANATHCCFCRRSCDSITLCESLCKNSSNVYSL